MSDTFTPAPPADDAPQAASAVPDDVRPDPETVPDIVAQSHDFGEPCTCNVPATGAPEGATEHTAVLVGYSGILSFRVNVPDTAEGAPLRLTVGKTGDPDATEGTYSIDRPSGPAHQWEYIEVPGDTPDLNPVEALERAYEEHEEAAWSPFAAFDDHGTPYVLLLDPADLHSVYPYIEASGHRHTEAGGAPDLTAPVWRYRITGAPDHGTLRVLRALLIEHAYLNDRTLPPEDRERLVLMLDRIDVMLAPAYLVRLTVAQHRVQVAEVAVQDAGGPAAEPHLLYELGAARTIYNHLVHRLSQAL